MAGMIRCPCSLETPWRQGCEGVRVGGKWGGFEDLPWVEVLDFVRGGGGAAEREPARIKTSMPLTHKTLLETLCQVGLY